jgi:hypothetical protein
MANTGQGTVASAPKARDGFDYADLSLKVLVPVAIALGTIWFNGELERRREYQACLDVQFSLIEFVCGDNGKACAPPPERAKQIPNVVKLVKARCEVVGAGDDIVQAGEILATGVAASATASTGNADQTAKVVNAAQTARPAPAALPQNSVTAPRAEAAIASSATAAAVPPRLYIQVKSEEQRIAARSFQAAVAKSTLRGQPLRAPGIEVVPRSGVTKTEIRCVTKADCLVAPDLAAYLGTLLGQGPLPVRDLSARYEGRSGTRPLHFEIWFGDGPIPAVVTAGPATATPPSEASS